MHFEIPQAVTQSDFPAVRRSLGGRSVMTPDACAQSPLTTTSPVTLMPKLGAWAAAKKNGAANVFVHARLS